MILWFAEPPDIIVKPSVQATKAAGVASFWCSASGTPKPQIHWRKNGKKISGKFFIFK